MVVVGLKNLPTLCYAYFNPPTIKCGTLSSIVDFLIDHANSPNNSLYLHTLFLMFHQFSNADSLFQILRNKYDSLLQRDSAPPFEAYLHLLKFWLTREDVYCWDDPQLLQHMSDLLKHISANPPPHFHTHFHFLSHVLDNTHNKKKKGSPPVQAKEDIEEKKEEKKFSESPYHKMERFVFDQIGYSKQRAIQLAYLLTMFDQKQFKRVTLKEFVGLRWSKDDGREAPNLRAMIFRFNAISTWIATSLVFSAGQEERNHKITFFFHLSEALFRLNNYTALLCLSSAFQGTPFHKLKKEGLVVVPKGFEVFTEEVKQLWNENAKKYRQLLQSAIKSKTSVVPYVGTHLTDLTFGEEGKVFVTHEEKGRKEEKKEGEENIRKHINWSKKVMLMEWIQTLRDARNSAYVTYFPSQVASSENISVKAEPSTVYKVKNNISDVSVGSISTPKLQRNLFARESYKTVNEKTVKNIKDTKSLHKNEDATNSLLPASKESLQQVKEINDPLAMMKEIGLKEIDEATFESVLDNCHGLPSTMLENIVSEMIVNRKTVPLRPFHFYYQLSLTSTTKIAFVVLSASFDALLSLLDTQKCFSKEAREKLEGIYKLLSKPETRVKMWKDCDVSLHASLHFLAEKVTRLLVHVSSFESLDVELAKKINFLCTLCFTLPENLFKQEESQPISLVDSLHILNSLSHSQSLQESFLSLLGCCRKWDEALTFFKTFDTQLHGFFPVSQSLSQCHLAEYFNSQPKVVKTFEDLWKRWEVICPLKQVVMKELKKYLNVQKEAESVRQHLVDLKKKQSQVSQKLAANLETEVEALRKIQTTVASEIKADSFEALLLELEREKERIKKSLASIKMDKQCEQVDYTNRNLCFLTDKLLPFLLSRWKDREESMRDSEKVILSPDEVSEVFLACFTNIHQSLEEKKKACQSETELCSKLEPLSRSLKTISEKVSKSNMVNSRMIERMRVIMGNEKK